MNNSLSVFWSKKWRWYGVLIFFFLMNLLLRAWKLTANPLGGDEPFTLYHAQMNPGMIISELTKGNNPPFFELLLHYWITGRSLALEWIRILPLIFSALTVVFVLDFGKILKNEKFAIAVALLYTFSTYHLQYAHEVRVYSFFGLLTMISMSVFYRQLKLQATVLRWILLILVNSLLIYSHYFGFFVLFLQTIFVFFQKGKWTITVKAYLIYVCAMVLMYLPLIPIVLDRFVFSSGGTTWLTAPSSAVELYNMLWKFSNKPVTTVVSLLILLAAAVKFFIQKEKVISLEVKILITWFCFSFFGMYLISFKVPMFLDRYLIYGSFAYLLLLVWAIFYLTEYKSRFQNGILGLIILLFAVTFQTQLSTNRDAIAIQQAVINAQKDGRKVVICPRDYTLNFLYYYDLDLFQEISVDPIANKQVEQLKSQGIYCVWSREELKSIESDSKFVYIDVAAHLINPNHGILDWMNERSRFENATSLDKITTAYYFTKD